MVEGFDVISAQLKDIESEVLEFNVGVSHLALDEERERYTRIRERIESIIDGLSKKETTKGKMQLETAQRLLTAATGNTETLRYLESISCLENIFTDVTKATTVTAVGLSSDGSISQRLLASRLLTDSVKQCWDYTTQLSNLTAIHLKSAADFHIFNHEIYEIRAQAVQMKAISAVQIEAFSPDGRIIEASSLNDEMKARLSAFQDLAERARTLVLKAPSVLPVENRLLEVRDGVANDYEGHSPLMVQMLIDYVGCNFTVRKGDSLPLLDTTENPNLWKVMTKSGLQYVPSIACIIVSSNGEQVHDAYRTLATVKEAWNEALDNYRRQLAIYYVKYLQKVVNGRGLHVADAHAKKHFIEDLNRLLIQPGADEGRLSSLLEMLKSKIVDRADKADEAWNRTDANLLHQPLLVLHEHIKSLRNMDESVESSTSRMKEYTSAFALESRGLQAQLESVRLTQDRNRAELKDLYDRVHNWRSVYTVSLDRPSDGVGRLILSSDSSSSGVSSLEGPLIPQPPSPFGRITPTEVQEALEFLETRPRRVRMNASEKPPKSKVFACRANLNRRQIPTSVKVVDVEKPKMIRDVATNTRSRRTIKNTQTDKNGDMVTSRSASTQSGKIRVDSMTQIGWIKAQKAQQVDHSIISEALEVNKPAPSIASATDGAIPDKVQLNFTTGPPKEEEKRDVMFHIGNSRQIRRNSGDFQVEKDSLDSVSIAAYSPTRKFDFDSKKRGRDTITQVNQFSGKTDLCTQSTGMESAKLEMKPNFKKVSVQTRLDELVPGKQESTKAWNNTHLQTECDIDSIQFETVPHPQKSYNEGFQIFCPPKAQGTTDGRTRNAEYGQQAFIQESKRDTEARNLMMRGEYSGIHRHQIQYSSEDFARDTSYCELNVDDGSLSDIDIQFSEPKRQQTSVVNGRRPRVANECTSYERMSQQIQTDNISFNFYTMPHYGRCETPKVESRGPELRTSGCQVGTKLIPREIRVSALSVGVDDRMMAGKLEVPMHSVLCPASVNCQPILTEEAGIQMMDVKDVDSVQIQTDRKSYLAGVESTKPKLPMSSIQVVPRETCFIEFRADPHETNNENVNFVKSTTDRGTYVPRVLAEAECQFKVTSDLATTTSYTDSTHLASCGIKPSQRHSSCQVGIVLVPETMVVCTAPFDLTNIDQSEKRDIAVDAVICPTKVKVRPVLTEDVGIHFAKTMGLEQMNVEIADKVYNATVSSTSRYHSGGVEVTGPQICVLEMDCGEDQAEDYTMTVTQDVNEGGMMVYLNKPQRQLEITSQPNCPTCHRQLETSWSTTETTSRKLMSISKSTHSVETQVGAVLKPTRFYMANVEIQPRTTEIARQMGMTPNAIICPSTVELSTQLCENGGIQVMDVKGVSNMEFVAGSSAFESSFVSRRGTEISNISRMLPVLNNMNIICGRTGLTLGQEGTNRSMSRVESDSETFVLQNIGCDFVIKDASVGAICASCLEARRVEQSVGGITSILSTSVDLSRKPSFIHHRASTPLSKNAECQVGVILRPQSIQVSNISVSPRNRTIADYLGQDVDSILCPANLQVTSEIGETSGIELLNLRDESCIKIQAKDTLLDADLESRTSDASFASRRKHGFLMNLRAGPGIVTLGPSTPEIPDKSLSESFRLSDAGCEIVLRDTGAGRVCSSCQGTGRMTITSIQLSRPFETSSIEHSTYILPATTASRSARSESKSCQVGSVLIPTNVNIASIEMFPRNISTDIASGSIVYPSTVDLESRLMEMSGIQIKDVANTDDVAFIRDSEKFESSVVRSNRVPEKITLEVRSFNPVSSGKFSLQNIGCKFRLKEVGAHASPSNSRLTSVSALETQAPVETGMKIYPVPQVKHVSSQVGLSLVPKRVQVADMSATASDKRVAAKLGLKADALICPSSVDLEMNLTETGGVSITDIKDLREVAIRVGESRGVLSITGRNMKMFDRSSTLTDAACLTFVCNKPRTAYQGVKPSQGKPFESTTTLVNKMFDQCARCTFRLEGSNEMSVKRVSSSKHVRKAEAGCQVGVLMVPGAVKVSAVKMVPEDKTSSNTMGVTKQSTLHSSTCELEPQISERTGIQIAQLDAAQKVQLELGGQIYKATVIPPRSATSSPWSSRPTRTSITGSPVYCSPSPLLSQQVTRISNVIGPYLLSLKDGATQKQSTVEVAGLTLGGNIVQLRVNADLRGKFLVRSGQQGDRRFSGFLDSSQRSSSSSERYHSYRPNSRLCDVACEALIKPETLEKRLQTLFI